MITAANGKKSIDTVTVTIGGKAPTHVAASASIQMRSISSRATAHDRSDCSTGDLIILQTRATILTTNVLMWKPVRLQGVGAASSIINANTHPAGKLDPWREGSGLPVRSGDPMASPNG